MIWRTARNGERERKFARRLIRYFASRAGELSNMDMDDGWDVESDLLSSDYADIVKEEFAGLTAEEKRAVGFGLLMWVPIYCQHYRTFADTLVGVSCDMVELERLLGETGFVEA